MVLKIPNSFNRLKKVSQGQGAGSIFRNCREEQGGIPNGSRVAADSNLVAMRCPLPSLVPKLDRQPE
jgi:hypothetical protein